MIINKQNTLMIMIMTLAAEDEAWTGAVYDVRFESDRKAITHNGIRWEKI